MKHLIAAETRPNEYSAYSQIIGADLYQEVLDLAKPLRGAKINIINSTSQGGGVAEILRGFVPLLHSLGIDANWLVLSPDEQFFNVTKGLHNGLQGQGYNLTHGDSQTFLNYNREVAAEAATMSADIWEIHDPQPAAIASFANLKNTIWRCHIDTSTPNAQVWQFLAPFIAKYDRVVFTLREFLGSGIDPGKTHFVVPTIDPLSSKNLPMTEEAATKIIDSLYIDTQRPFVAQISRFDRWKDPLGVIDAYRLAKVQVPKLQLVLAGSMATDDPEGWQVFDQAKEHARGDKDIHLLTQLKDIEISALQTSARVIIQKSIKEGFGLTVSEGLWHGRPAIGGNTGGIKLQIQEGKNGYLVENVADCARAVVELVQNPKLADQMGKAGQAYVGEHFLLPRLVRDHLKLYHKILKI